MEEKVLKNENKMGTMPVRSLLISMSLPMMISMLVQALYNVVDSMFVSSISESALTAVSLAFPVQNLMIAIGSGTGVGINAMLSKCLGEKDQKGTDRAANNGIFLTVLSWLLFVLIGIFGIHAYFSVQTQITEIVDYGTIYMKICSIASFGAFFQMTFERLLQSTGKTFYTMITQGTGAIINIILDPILIFGMFGLPRMGVAGAAVATVIGQVIAALLALYFNLRKNHEIHLGIRGFRPHGATIKRIYGVGVPSIIMISIGSVMIYLLNQILLGFSATATAVLGVYFKLQSFVFMPVFGLNNGIIPILAYNYGAKKKDRINECVKFGLIYAVAIMLVGMIIFQLIPTKLLSLFNASPDMMGMGVVALRIVSLCFVMAACGIVLGGVFQAFGESVLSMYVSLGRQIVILLPAAFLLARTGSVNNVWWAFPIAEGVSFIMSLLFFRHTYNKCIKPLE